MPSAADIKGRLKQAGMTMAGTKQQMDHRLSLYTTCVKLGLTVEDGKNPCSLSFAALKKVAATYGVSPIGNQDEVLTELVGVLEKAHMAGGGAAEKSYGKGGMEAGKSEGGGNFSSAAERKELMLRVMRLADEGQEGFRKILAIGNKKISETSSFDELRKAYLKNKGVHEATKAFQGLVRAFEGLTRPSVPADAEARDSGAGKLARSNEGCVRTKIKCPRCKEAWAESKIEGNPDYYYNFLMMGLKCFTCATCLCEFGCMAAVHLCPWCKKAYEYNVEDYHRKIVCGNEGCKRPFGFYMYSVSERVLKELRDEVKKEVEQAAKLAEQTRRRNAAEERRNGGTHGTQGQQERAFELGLADECPRCGEPLVSFKDGFEQRQHLRNCNDEKAHSKHAAVKKQREDTGNAIEEQKRKQQAAQSSATWQLLGGKAEHLWLLTHEASQREAAKAGVAVSPSKDKAETLAAMARAVRSSQNALTYEEGSSLTAGKKEESKSLVLFSSSSSSSSSLATLSSNSKGKKTGARSAAASISASLPSNYHSMSAEQLRCVCAAHNILSSSMACKADYVKAIERLIFDDDDTSGDDGDVGDKKRGNEKEREGSDEEYVAGEDEDGSEGESIIPEGGGSVPKPARSNKLKAEAGQAASSDERESKRKREAALQEIMSKRHKVT